jgi:hypothetical protein
MLEVGREMTEIPDTERVKQRRAVLIASFALIAVFGATLLIPALMHNNTYEVVFTAETTANASSTLFDTVPHRRMDAVVWLELEPGDTLVIRNTDTVIHELAGMSVRPGETILHTFHERGTFSGDCSVINLTVFIEVQRR